MPSKIAAYPFEQKNIAEVACFLKENNFAVRDGFLDHVCFENPCHVAERDVFLRGSVLRDGSQVVGFVYSAIRDGFWCQTPLVISIHGCLCVKEEYRPHLATCYMPIIRQEGIDIHLVNTANSNGQRTLKAMRAFSGDVTNSVVRYRGFSWPGIIQLAMSKHKILRRFPSFLGTLPAKILLNPWCRFKYPLPQEKTGTKSERLSAFDEVQFGPFWDNILAKNQGMLLSRKINILRWLFQENIDRAKDILLARFDEGRLVGYIILRCSQTSDKYKRYSIMDWIAEDQNEDILNDLLCDACHHVQSENGMILESIGFPSRVLPTIQKSLPLARSIGGNAALVIAKDKALRSKVQKDQSGWFWGPYDGDRAY